MNLVHRIYTERKENHEALSLLRELGGFENIRILNRYDVQGLSDEMLEICKFSIFAEPFTDNIINELPDDADKILAVEFLPGQYDQRADAAEQCASLLLGFRPVIKTARIYLFYYEHEKNEPAKISEAEGDNELKNENSGNIDAKRTENFKADIERAKHFEAVKKFLINPVEAREAQLKEYDTLELNYAVPADVETIKSFDDVHGLAMSSEDLACCEKYFASEGRMPTRTEIKVLDTYWSDHCRHTTFLTQIDDAEIHDEKVLEAYKNYLAIRKELNYPDDKPITLMDIATIGAKYLNHPDVVISEENNACTVRIKVDGENWLLLFKNETHNHPTEIEPFGGAATCIGGAIRDPLSGRAYVYQAMRITGAADPSQPTMPGKLSQRAIITKAAQGYSSYGNQIGIPTGLVDEIYHEGYKAKRLEVGAVIAAVRENNVIRERPEAGDYIILLGGRTGRDGIGGATGSSISHTSSSIETCGAEVQKGNAPEERKLQRLFRNPEFTRLIKRCNDFGAGGVSVAVGELAEGLDINLDAVPLKYAGLDGTEIAVSESQERMAVVVSSENVERVKNLALSEDVQASVIASVNNSGRMRMTWRGQEIVNLSREFINSNGASRHIKVKVNPKIEAHREIAKFPDVLSNLNICSKRGLSERFDSTVGAHSVLMPFGGKFQKTPAQVMAAKIPVGIDGETDICSLMSWGFDPEISSRSSFEGAYLAVLEALSKIIASGGDLSHCWLTLQEYFGKPEHNPEKWGLPFGALLGALKAQIDFGVPAIGGKDSMSGSFVNSEGETLDVPPTLIAFAVSLSDAKNIISPEFKRAGSKVALISPEYDERGLPERNSMLKIFAEIKALNSQGKILACAIPTFGGVISQVFKMCLGNNLGFEFTNKNISDDRRGKFIVEFTDEIPEGFCELGRVLNEPEIIYADERIKLSEAEKIYDEPLSGIFPVTTENKLNDEKNFVKAEFFQTDIREAEKNFVKTEFFPTDTRADEKNFVEAEFFPTDTRADEKNFVEAGISPTNTRDDENDFVKVEFFQTNTRADEKNFVEAGVSPTNMRDAEKNFVKAGVSPTNMRADEKNFVKAEFFPTDIREAEKFYSEESSPKSFYSHEAISSPKFLIPVFAGTNCEYETARAINNAGGRAKIFVVRTLTPELMKQSAEEFAYNLRNSQALVLPGGFSNGDEPDGSGKFIAIFLRSPEVREALENLLDVRGGLACGICNGFQALVKTGLLPYGKITEPEKLCATLTFNKIGRHQSRIIRSKVIANNSAWLSKTKIGEIYSIPISHGEGRFICSENIYTELMRNNQIAGQYVDLEGRPSILTEFNPSGSCYAVECVTSPDGRILGRMGHVERKGRNLYVNVPGNYDMKLFEGACEYFRKA